MSDLMIEAKALSKQYGKVHALRDVSFQISKGEVVGLLGPNGAGKTTTMKILTCFIPPSEGSATINGADIFEDPMGVRQSIGYLPESTPLYQEMFVVDYLDYVAQMRGHKGAEAKRRIKKVVEQTSLGEVIGKEIRALSKGYKQRVGLAQALVHEPEVLILDEPMSGLDPNQAAEIRELITQIGQERTVILSTHDLGEIQQTCDRVLIISKGKLVADDTPEGLRSQSGATSFVLTLATAFQEGYRGSKDQSPEEVAKNVLSLLPYVRDVRVERVRSNTREGDELFCIVRPQGNHDLRELLFRAAVDNKLTLLGLERRVKNLQHVFRDLTTSAQAAPRVHRGSAKARAAESFETIADKEEE